MTNISVTGNSNEIPILKSNNSVGHLTQVNEGKPISFIYTICFYRSFGIHNVISLWFTFSKTFNTEITRNLQNTRSVSKMLDELEWPSLEARRDQSSLLLFHKIHCGAMSIDKDKYMTPAYSLKTTRSSHSAQYRRHQTYSDALKISFFPQTIPHCNSLSPSVANTKSMEELRTLFI